jgi:restriction system protein
MLVYLLILLAVVFAIATKGYGVYVLGVLLVGFYLYVIIASYPGASKRENQQPRLSNEEFRRVSNRLQHRELQRQKIAVTRNLEDVLALDPVEFENFVGGLFKRMGYDVSTTPKTGDEGVDLVLRKDGRLGVVQCKHYKESVGQPVVRDMYGTMVHEKADEAFLVTPGVFTEHAKQWARGHPIRLVDGKKLLDWMREFNPDSNLTFPGAGIY